MSGNRHNNNMGYNNAGNTGPLSGGVNGGSGYSVQQELQWVKNDVMLIRNAVVLLEEEKDNLRQAVRKLKLENKRMHEKLKKLSSKVTKLDSDEEEDDEIDVDYFDLGRGDFLLLGGPQDPLALRYEVTICDEDGKEHKSAERYYWYKLAMHFGDEETAKRILEASSTIKAEEAMKDTAKFNESEWNKVKMQHWSRGQQLKLEQVRWIACLLVESKGKYLAVSHQDKTLGTGWRKNRDEANKPIFWDGRNEGGKWLMTYRKEISTKHDWAGPNEMEETRRKFNELRQHVWRKIEQNTGGQPGYANSSYSGSMRGGRGGSRGYGSGMNSGGMNYGAPPRRNNSGGGYGGGRKGGNKKRDEGEKVGDDSQA